MTEREVKFTVAWEMLVGITLGCSLATLMLRTIAAGAVLCLLVAFPGSILAMFLTFLFLSVSTLLTAAAIAPLVGLQCVATDWSVKIPAEFRDWQPGMAYNNISVNFKIKWELLVSITLLCALTVLALQCLSIAVIIRSPCAEFVAIAVAFLTVSSVVGDILLALMFGFWVAVLAVGHTGDRDQDDASSSAQSIDEAATPAATTGADQRTL